MSMTNPVRRASRLTARMLLLIFVFSSVAEEMPNLE